MLKITRLDQLIALYGILSERAINENNLKLHHLRMKVYEHISKKYIIKKDTNLKKMFYIS